jgi:hypothetical protein
LESSPWYESAASGFASIKRNPPASAPMASTALIAAVAPATASHLSPRAIGICCLLIDDSENPNRTPSTASGTTGPTRGSFSLSLSERPSTGVSS